MNRQKLTELILHPERISTRESSLLQDMAAQYPYATNIQILLAKSKQQHPDARQHLATAALYTPNRGVLRMVMEDKLPKHHKNKPQAGADTREQRKEDPNTPTGNATIVEHTAALSVHPDTALTPEQPPQVKEDIFDELQKNLKRLREEREKQYPQSTQEKDKPENSAPPQLKSTSGGTSEVDSRNNIHPTLQQLIEDHEQHAVDNPRVKQQRSLIDSFLENAPSMQRRQQLRGADNESVTDLTQNISFTPQDLATETLALIMERQGKTEKAIDIYQKLILKYPQKSAYFADCIERLKNNSR